MEKNCQQTLIHANTERLNKSAPAKKTIGKRNNPESGNFAIIFSTKFRRGKCSVRKWLFSVVVVVVVVGVDIAVAIVVYLLRMTFA